MAGEPQGVGGEDHPQNLGEGVAPVQSEGEQPPGEGQGGEAQKEQMEFPPEQDSQIPSQKNGELFEKMGYHDPVPPAMPRSSGAFRPMRRA